MPDVTQIGQRGTGTNLQAEYAAVVVASNSTIFPPSTLFIGTAGNVNVVTAEGNTVLFKNLLNASFLPVLVTQVLSTSTTATDIVRLS